MSKEDKVRQIIAARRLKLEPFGKGWRITGHGVHVVTASLSNVDPEDLCALRGTYKHETGEIAWRITK